MRRAAFMPILLALLIAGLCLTNLTGCAERGQPEPAPDTEQNTPDPLPEPEPAGPEASPLTEEELRFFNEEFFNGDYMNIRNQFLSSVYDTPADINLYDLFYCGTGWDERMEDEEWAAFEAAGGFMETDVTKVSTANANAVLTEYLGLPLEETNQAGLDSFIHLPDYDAYYLAHGDTNYRMEVTFSSGTRENEMIHLYYEDTFFCDGWKCVTLRETADSYQFVSNMHCEESEVPNT